jgi:hypothetical protein
VSDDNISILSDNVDYKKIEDKLVLLYLIDKMDIPLTCSQIDLFALGEQKLDYFLLQQNLTEMTQSGYLENFEDDNTTRYIITEEGLNILEYFKKQMPMELRNKIHKYVYENQKTAKKDYGIIANHFLDYNNNEYLVRCGLYEDESMLLEVNLSVVSKEQAQFICKNWKENVQYLYSNILSLLITPRNEAEKI